MMRGMNDTLLVTGMSGAGKSTVLRTLEDLGWEIVDNLPLTLLDRLLSGASADTDRSLAIGLGAATRDFDPHRIISHLKHVRDDYGSSVGTLFLDCAGLELARRYSETRRRHPLALDRPVSDGIVLERELVDPLRRWANRLIDTTSMTANELAQQVRDTFAADKDAELILQVASFGFARGILRNADLVFDMRFLQNPHWISGLRPGTGKDPDVSAYIAADPAYESSLSRIEELLVILIPRYRAEAKAYVTIAFGCTGGRHRSVHVAERVAERLRREGFSLTVAHRDLGAAPQDALEESLACR